MANCNCNKCNPTRNCGCADSPDRTPCTYSDCSVGSERCSDVQCTECVSYCGTTFQVGTAGSIVKIETGERLDSIIQKMALMMSQGIGGCTSDDLHHAPYNVYATQIDRDNLKRPDFDWAETFCTLLGNTIRIYKNKDFEIVNAVLTFYERPTYIEFAGATNPYTGVVSLVDVESEFKDDVVELIIDETAAIIAGDIENFNQATREQQAAERSN